MNNSGGLSSKTIYLIIDELSGMHLKHERYFGIGGYLINDINYIRSTCKKIEQKLKFENSYINKLDEIKGCKLLIEHSVDYISYVRNNANSFVPVSILVDKHNLKKQEWNENEAFNFFVKWLVNYLIKCKIIDTSKYQNIEIHMDNRTIATNFKNSLETHLNLHFHNYNVNFSVIRKDSKIYPEIRCADIICYMLHRMYNYFNSKKTNILIGLLKNQKINLFQYQSFFPYENKQNLIKNLVFLEEDDKIIK